ncbi:MAG TPA: homogentisate 1,2-dioxygenase [Acidobacteriota bacterium]|nr:homogentisate 1,2-dioxygenase [Acidobacteriota bacterium]
MPIYHSLGELPRKRHIAFRKPQGGLYPEELVGNKGFVGPSSLVYHLHPPTQVEKVSHLRHIDWSSEEQPEVRHRHFRTAALNSSASPTLDRIPLLFNNDVALSYVEPTEKSEDFFYRNAQGDEVVYVSDGEGRLETPMGHLSFSQGDYLVIPRGILHRYRIASDDTRFLVIESAGYVRTPRRYRNEFGQMLEGAPFSERDIRRPDDLPTRDESGAFRLVIKKGSALTEVILKHHPFDLVGWDGYYYPWAFNIHDFEPKVARVHLPPPVHQTFEGDGFVICSFCPRPYDFDPEAVPAPYNHSNVMSDEVLYYASPEFMSRKGIEYGSVTLHPDGIPHGPHPGKAEESMGMKETKELAVMLDTFRPLKVSRRALQIEDREYQYSWLEGS